MSLISLGELFQQWNEENKEIVIPLLQRNYKWKQGNDNGGNNTAAKLILDILNKCVAKDEEHIIGLITAYKKDKDSDIQIIDGQQRLITLSLIAKALEKENDSEWIKITFERDMDGKPRESFIYGNEDNTTSVDVGRMKTNLAVIKALIGGRNKDEIFDCMLKNIKLMYRETTCEPLEEFLNMNFKKTPFCASDYIKAYMLMDCTSEPDKTKDEIKTDDVLTLWRSIQFKLFSLENKYCVSKRNSFTHMNDMFELISKNYEEKNTNKRVVQNRVDILFADRYYNEHISINDDNDEKEKSCAQKYYDNKPTDKSSLKAEYERLQSYNRILDELLNALCISGIDGKPRPNYTAYNAYELLFQKSENQKYRNKNLEGVRFFKLFQDKELCGKEGVCLNTLIEQFSHQDLDKLNQFAAALMDSYDYASINHEYRRKTVARIELVYQKVHEEKTVFAKLFKGFQEVFDEYLEIINSTKSGSNEPAAAIPLHSAVDYSSVDREKVNKSHTLKELTESVNEIIIPCIQRDYVMGSFAEDGNPQLKYIEIFLSKIRFMEMRAYFEQQSLEFKPDLKYKNGAPVSLEIPEDFKERLLEKIFPLDKDIGCDLFNENSSFDYIFIQLSVKDWRLKCYVTDKFLREKLGIKDNSEKKDIPYEVHKDKLFGDKIRICCNDNTLDERYADNSEYKNLVRALASSIIEYLKPDCFDYSKPFTTMNFSCITGYLDDNGRFWVYDGQQRLSTVVVLLAASLFRKYDEDVVKIVRKFKFDGRDNANKMLEEILDCARNKNSIPDTEARLRSLITDQTCYSIYTLFCRLLREYYRYDSEQQWNEFKKIGNDYLLNGLSFELVVTDSISDSEQLFIELNEGEHLIDEEKYKAYLSAELGKIVPAERVNIMRKVDNEWLDKWGSEVTEFKWLQYCMTFAHHELKGFNPERRRNELNGIDENVVNLALAIFDGISFKGEKLTDDIYQWIKTLEYSEKTTCINGKIHFSKEEFKLLIEKLEKNSLLKEAFEIIRQHRRQGFVKVETETVAEVGDSGSRGLDIKSLNLLLKHRQNRYRAAVYCGYSWVDESKPPFPVLEAKQQNRVFWVNTSSEKQITESEISIIDELLKALLYNNGKSLEKRTITIYRYISGADLRKLIEKNGGKLPENSRFDILNSTVKLDNVNNINESQWFKETVELTIEDILNSQFYNDCYKKRLEEILVNKGRLCRNLLNTDNSDGKTQLSARKCLELWVNSQPSKLRALIENFSEISDEDFGIIEGYVGECVKIERDDILQFASSLAVEFAQKGELNKSENDYQWLRYTVQNYLFEKDDYAQKLLEEQKNNVPQMEDKSNGMGFDLRSLFPAGVYLKQFVSEDERNRYISESGFACTDDNDNLLVDNNAIDKLISEYNKNFIL